MNHTDLWSWLRFIILFLSISGLYSPLAAQDCSDPEHPENCYIELPVFCGKSTVADFRISIEESTFDLLFEARFDGDSPEKNLLFYLVDGQITPGATNEVKITALRCRNSGNGGQTCSGTISAERAERLESRLDFDQAVLTVSLRTPTRDICVGKFTNNEELIENNGITERSLCSFTAADSEKTEGLTLTGDGFFDPRGYGADGESHFHMSLAGLPARETYLGCILVGENQYRPVFDFKSYGPNKSDQTIYGDVDADGEAKLSQEAIHYSYDVYRALDSSADPARLSLGGKSLSQINKQVSSPSASSEREKANSSRKKKSSRKRKRRKKKKNKRVRSLDLMPAESKSKGSGDIFSWLAFDPLGSGTIYISKSCRGNVPLRSYGSITCGNDGDSGSNRECVDFSNTDSEATSAGKICQEFRNSYSLSTIRVKSLAAGDYYVCLDGAAVSTALTVSGDEGEEFGTLEITDSATLAQLMSGLALYAGDLGSVSTVAVATSSSCTDTVMTAGVSGSGS